jgi:hypothetical protein
MGLILRLLLALLAFQLIAGVVRRLRGGPVRRAKKTPKAPPNSPEGEAQDYKDLTPYEIEDAEYDEMPKRED